MKVIPPPSNQFFLCLKMLGVMLLQLSAVVIGTPSMNHWKYWPFHLCKIPNHTTPPSSKHSTSISSQNNPETSIFPLEPSLVSSLTSIYLLSKLEMTNRKRKWRLCIFAKRLENLRSEYRQRSSQKGGHHNCYHLDCNTFDRIATPATFREQNSYYIQRKAPWHLKKSSLRSIQSSSPHRTNV